VLCPALIQVGFLNLYFFSPFSFVCIIQVHRLGRAGVLQGEQRASVHELSCQVLHLCPDLNEEWLLVPDVHGGRPHGAEAQAIGMNFQGNLGCGKFPLNLCSRNDRTFHLFQFQHLVSNYRTFTLHGVH
jgi:hypothetical protein